MILCTTPRNPPRGKALEILRAAMHTYGHDRVTRDELRKALWPDHTFVNFEDGLNHAIRRLREALGDSAEHPRFIETLPRRGYRFIAPLQAPLSEEKPAAASNARLLLRAPWIGWLVLATAIFIGCALFLLGRSHPEALHIQSIAVIPLENLSGDSAQEYFSDGVTRPSPRTWERSAEFVSSRESR